MQRNGFDAHTASRKRTSPFFCGLARTPPAEMGLFRIFRNPLPEVAGGTLAPPSP